VELGAGYIGAGSTPMDVFLEDIKQLPTNFPKAKHLYLALGEDLPRPRQWFRAFCGKPEMADQVAVWGSPQLIADRIVRLGNAGVKPRIAESSLRRRSAKWSSFAKTSSLVCRLGSR